MFGEIQILDYRKSLHLHETVQLIIPHKITNRCFYTLMADLLLSDRARLFLLLVLM